MKHPVIRRIVRECDWAQGAWDSPGGQHVGLGPKVTLLVHDVRELLQLAIPGNCDTCAHHQPAFDTSRPDHVWCSPYQSHQHKTGFCHRWKAEK